MPDSDVLAHCCPACGRRLRICREHAHQTMACQHCHARFQADLGQPACSGDWRTPLMKRADELLSLAAAPGV